MNWTVEYLNETVRAETLGLPLDMLASIFKIIALIEEAGLERVGMPFVLFKENCGKCADEERMA